MLLPLALVGCLDSADDPPEAPVVTKVTAETTPAAISPEGGTRGRFQLDISGESAGYVKSSSSLATEASNVATEK